jgi:hypothetical protein
MFKALGKIYADLAWIILGQDMDQKRAVVGTVMNIFASQKYGDVFY